MTRIFFATDLHGSEVCWKKFLNAPEFYDVSVLILGGDMTGKALIPLVGAKSRYEVVLQEHRYVLASADEVQQMERRIAGHGYYAVRVDPDQMAELQANPQAVDRLFQEQMRSTLERWMTLAREKLSGKPIRCFVCPGNDDRPETDEVIADSRVVELAEGRVVDVDGIEMISTGWSNPTPWETYRACSEEQLASRITDMADGVHDPGQTIFNLHCPPYGSKLDEAPALDSELRPRHAGQLLQPVGSTAVRDAIMRYQPILSLHGHIHEAKGVARLGRTLAINPGSSYESGTLQGSVIKIDAGRRHRVRPGGDGVVVHPLALGADLREHPLRAVLRSAAGYSGAGRSGPVVQHAQRDFRQLLDPGGLCQLLHRHRHGGVCQDSEVLLLGRHRRPGGGPPPAADRHPGAVPAGVQSRSGASLWGVGGRLRANDRGIAQVRVHAASLRRHAVGSQHPAHSHGRLLPAVAQLGSHPVWGSARRQ